MKKFWEGIVVTVAQNWIYLMSLDYTLKNGEFHVVYILPQ